ncbi:secondary thiamine-phosphate synthase enzyme YjbQ [Halodesulfovibrio marinisediminis]|uniref:Secondary thiamine-phosphate synthase enzyme n=1 Tax=Halodesulfovibrio marinisediminis DSM 17456 TaxID=1121457 RepID=A0A1N6F9W7_9BACT|nr:secondary thiamine-phosphate synthase enzyme YjbQ [Halodesulfovibrio marinisediminis]SIN91986.1 secondary thiamine-phosphate synthase enzyme [Halodesulfovibrio marinisediminis DSM 17456]
MEKLEIRTSTREELIDITSRVQTLVSENNWEDGMLLLFCPHTTGAVTVNEGADPDVARDITVNMRHIVPYNGDYKHMEGNSDAHIKASMFGPDQMLIVENGRVQLGTWQAIYFCEFDGARNRKLWVKFIPS